MSLNSAESYSRNVDPILEVARSIIENNKKLLKWYHTDLSVMDIGIGDGRMAREVIVPVLPTFPKEYVGCDISDSVLEHAKGIMNMSTFKTIKMDIATSNLPEEMENRFTNIFSNICLHNIKDSRQAFKNIYKMLKPQGQFFISTFRETPLDPVYEELDRGLWRQYDNFKANSPFYKNRNAVEEYRKIIEEIGFENCYIKGQPDYSLRFSEEALDEIHLSVNPRIQHVCEEDKKAYEADYLNTFKSSDSVKLVAMENGKNIYNIIFKLIVAVGTKPKDNYSMSNKDIETL